MANLQNSKQSLQDMECFAGVWVDEDHSAEPTADASAELLALQRARRTCISVPIVYIGALSEADTLHQPPRPLLRGEISPCAASPATVSCLPGALY